MLEISILVTLLCQCNPNSCIECTWQIQTLDTYQFDNSRYQTHHFDPIIQLILQSKEIIAILASAAVPICKKKWSK